MPFHRGVAPIRRTLKYLEKGTIVFKERVKVMTVNYNELHRNTPKHTNLDQHQGARDFVFWNLPQVRMIFQQNSKLNYWNMFSNPSCVVLNYYYLFISI